MSMFGFVEWITDSIATSLESMNPIIVVLILFGVAFFEYIFPPFPGDVVILTAAFFVSQGVLDPMVTWVALFLGSFTGSMLVYLLGFHRGRSLFEPPAAEAGKIKRFFKRLLFNPAKLKQIEKLFAKYGPLVIVANRFLPAIRAFFFLAAGCGRMKAWKVGLYSGISIAIWNSVMMALGYLAGRNKEKVFDWFETYQRIILALMLILLVIWIARKIIRKRSGKDDEDTGETRETGESRVKDCPIKPAQEVPDRPEK